MVLQTEKLDTLLVLALAFENTLAESDERTVLQLTEQSFSAMSADDFLALKSRAEFLDNLPDKKRELWREIHLEKILRRNKTFRLDENINPVRLVNVLSSEPPSIQKLILRNLPADLSQRIAYYLELDFKFETENGDQIHSEITELIKREFLSKFISFDELFEPNELDKISVLEITNFIHQLGLREIAVACRGISSKETLAAFVNRFAEEDVKEIVNYLTELDNVKPFWVAQADEIVRDYWDENQKAHKILDKIGFKLLSIAFINREENAINYTTQKFSTKDVLEWQIVLKTSEKEFEESGDDAKLRIEKRRKMVEKLAAKFNQTGRL